MSKRFLGVWASEAGLNVEVCEVPGAILLRPRGRVGGLVPAVQGGDPAQLKPQTTIAFLFASRPAQLLAAIAGDLPREDKVLDRAFLTHGHASIVLMLDSADEWEKVKTVLEPHLRGYETWNVRDGFVPADNVVTIEPNASGMPDVPHIDPALLGFESAAHVRQFNSNLALLARISWSYAPEVWPLIERLGDLVTEIAKTLAENSDASTENRDSIRARIHLETVLIETNAVVSLYCSQLGSGVLPLHQSAFSVGEYSLFGIGGMGRAAWRLYHHLNLTFAKFDHASVLRDRYPDIGAFDPYGGSATVRDFSTWRSDRYSMERHAKGAVPKPRYHVPYFSSRWGYHESLHSISLSWQSLYASATKEWNLLTLTHEFLHSQVRAMFAEILRTGTGVPNLALPEPDDDLAARIVNAFNHDRPGESALESLQIAYADVLLAYEQAETLMREFSPDDTESFLDYDGTLTVDRLHHLVRLHSALIHEIAVHVLDFRYVYAGRDEEYVNSIWSSWSLVPSVSDRIDHYVLRTLCALSATSPDRDSDRLFEDARRRLVETLEPLAGRVKTRPAIAQAVALLKDPGACQRLQFGFSTLQAAVELTLSFFYDSRLNTALLDDPATYLDGDRFRFGLEPGTYEGVEIASPIGFLLDRFPHYADHAGADTEFESIWQMLQLI